MGELASWSERRRALRVPVRGVAVFYAEDGAMHGTIENLSSSGALVTVAGVPSDESLDVELKLGADSGCVDEQMRTAIEGAIDQALRAAQRRPILVIDDRPARRVNLATRLAARGMTPL